MPYYYLTASLPTLILGETAPYSMDEFLNQCAGLLRDEDLAELELMINEDNAAISDFAVKWRNINTQMLNAIARNRAGAYGLEAKEYLHEHTGFDVSVEQAVTDASVKANPLEQELALDHFRWQILEQLGQQDQFGMGKLIAYALQLKIAIRWSNFNTETGNKSFTEIIDNNLAGKLDL